MREGDVMDTFHEGFIFGVADFVAGEIAEVGAGGEDYVDAGNGRDFLGIVHADGGFDHDHHHHVVVDGLAVIVAIERAVLAVAHAAAALRRVFRPADGGLGLLDGVDCGDDDAERADVGGFLNIAFGGIGDADEGHGGGSTAGPDHVGDVGISKRAVLHFDPQEIVAGIGDSAVNVGIGGEIVAPTRGLPAASFCLAVLYILVCAGATAAHRATHRTRDFIGCLAFLEAIVTFSSRGPDTAKI